MLLRLLEDTADLPAPVPKHALEKVCQTKKLSAGGDYRDALQRWLSVEPQSCGEPHNHLQQTAGDVHLVVDDDLA